MYDSGKIIIGLLIFLVAMTFPIWYNAIGGDVASPPELEYATKGIPGRDACVMPADYMRPEHMALLDEWRTEVVRNGNRVYVAPDGRKFDRSLTNTCMDCHSNKDKFCDACHNYMAIVPYCWDCHIESEATK